MKAVVEDSKRCTAEVYDEMLQTATERKSAV